MNPTRTFTLCAASLILAAGCAAPIGATRTSPSQAYRQYASSVLNGDRTDTSVSVLRRFDLESVFRREPQRALSELHQRATLDRRRDLLFALAELNCIQADKLRRSVKTMDRGNAADIYLAAAVYSYLYLLGDGAEPPPTPFDRRFRVACDIHNYALGFAFRADRLTNHIAFPPQPVRNLAPGPVAIRFDPLGLDLGEIDQFLPADGFKIRGLSIRDRRSGLGAPLIAEAKLTKEKVFKHRFPVTVFLRVRGDLQAWSENRLDATLELHSSYETAGVEIAGQPVPLEADMTTPIAYALNDSYVWTLGRDQFFSYEQKIRTGIHPSQPYQRGRIPVIFVHGTFSSPVWWAEMVNTLRSDPLLRERFQFWYFMYNTGNPVPYSASLLRDAINSEVNRLDPKGEDEALRQMVLVGHSQGGLLAKMTGIHSGGALWSSTFSEPLDNLEFPRSDREKIRRLFFFEPVPSVKRVVFMSTPHRGSYQAKSWLRQIARRFVRLPTDVVQISGKLIRTQESEKTGIPSGSKLGVPTSVDGMAPDNPWLQSLASISLAPGVQGHSIIPVKRPAAPQNSSDGVVKYTSAHLEGMESELIIRGGHSCQDKPAAIEEVRRILLRHLDQLLDGQ